MKEKNLIEKYADATFLRALVQLIPNFGGAIDTLLYETGSKWRQERIEKFISDFGTKLELLTASNEQLSKNVHEKIDSEQFYDYFTKCMQDSIQSDSRNKIEKFSNLLVNYLTNFDRETAFEIYLNITRQLLEIEFELLVSHRQEYKTYFYLENNTLADLLKYKDYLDKNATFDNNEIPSNFIVSKEIEFLYSRLETMGLLTKNDDHSHSYFEVTRSSQYQSVTSTIPYRSAVVFQLTEFGRKYLEWVNEQK